MKENNVNVKYKPDGSAGFQVTNNQWWGGKQMLASPFVKDAWKVKVKRSYSFEIINPNTNYGGLMK
jgi:hypothetical protein